MDAGRPREASGHEHHRCHGADVQPEAGRYQADAGNVQDHRGVGANPKQAGEGGPYGVTPAPQKLEALLHPTRAEMTSSK